MDTTSAERIMLAEMHHYGLTQRGWTFKWDRAKGRNGQCDYYTKTISLSLPRTAQRDEMMVRNTIIHEIAHALTPGHGHGTIWKRKFQEMGGTGERCSTDRVAIDYKWTIKCPKDGRVLGNTHRKGKRLAASTCRCCGQFPIWQQNF